MATTGVVLRSLFVLAMVPLEEFLYRGLLLALLPACPASALARSRLTGRALSSLTT